MRERAFMDVSLSALILFIGSGITRYCLVSLKLSGLPDHSLRRLEASVLYNTAIDFGAGSHDIVEILNQLAGEHPDARAHVVNAMFHNSLHMHKVLLERANAVAQLSTQMQELMG